MARRTSRARGLTLLELLLAVGILFVLAALTIPRFWERYQAKLLPGSAAQFRSLISLVRSNAAFDGLRYRIRFPEEDEEDPHGGDQQPLIEREDDPIDDPEVFNLVTSPWAVGHTLLGEVWCAEVRLGRPTVERLRERRSGIEDAIDESVKEFSPERPPLLIEPDSTSDWVTFVLTQAPRDVGLDELDAYERIEVIVEGPTGLAWLQRPLFDEELDLFEEKNWPVVLRQDFLSPRILTEDDVLELRDSQLTP